MEEGWWKGKLKGKIGVFPSNFVEVMESASPMSANRTSSIGAKPTLLMDGHGAVSGGVAVLPTGHTGSLSKTNSLNKSRSSLNSSRENLDDVIPNQQQILPHDAPSLPPKPVRELCKVLFAYAPANEDELRLVEGDIITILSKELPDKGWWKGELKGRVGVFPDNFVSLMPPEGECYFHCTTDFLYHLENIPVLSCFAQVPPASNILSFFFFIMAGRLHWDLDCLAST